jgi:hypothetical protein
VCTVHCMHACGGLVCGEFSVTSLSGVCHAMCGECPWSGSRGGGIYAEVSSNDGIINTTSIVVSNVTATGNTASGCIACMQSFECLTLCRDLACWVRCPWRSVGCRHHDACARRGAVWGVNRTPGVHLCNACTRYCCLVFVT